MTTVMQASKARRRGQVPLIIRPPVLNKPDREWMTRRDFMTRVSEDCQRDLANVFRLPLANMLGSEGLADMFCTYNELIPILPIHYWAANEDAPQSGVRLQRRRTWRAGLSELVNPGHKKSWLPGQSLNPERLIPADDEYDSDDDPEEVSQDNVEVGGALGEQSQMPVRIEHELVYPPRPPIVGKDEETGEDLVQPLRADWLHAMLEEQEAEYEALKMELDNAIDGVRAATAEVVMIKGTLKSEEEEYDRFITEIKSICGLEVAENLKKLVRVGKEFRFLGWRDLARVNYSKQRRRWQKNVAIAEQAAPASGGTIPQILEVAHLPQAKQKVNGTTPTVDPNPFVVPAPSNVGTPLSGIISCFTGAAGIAGALFSKRRREDEDEGEKTPARDTEGGASEQDVRPHKRQRVDEGKGKARAEAGAEERSPSCIVVYHAVKPPLIPWRSTAPELIDQRFRVDLRSGAITLAEDYAYASPDEYSSSDEYASSDE